MDECEVFVFVVIFIMISNNKRWSLTQDDVLVKHFRGGTVL